MNRRGSRKDPRRFPLHGGLTQGLRGVIVPIVGDNPCDSHPVIPASPLYAAHLAHLEALRRQRRRPATLKIYRLYVGGYLQYLATQGIDNPGFECLTADLVGRYQDHVHGRSSGTRGGSAAEHQAVRLVKIFTRWLWRRGFVEADPLARIEAPRLQKLHRVPFSAPEVRLLLEAARQGPNPIMERALLLLGLDTGARIGELVATEIADLDLSVGIILFRSTKSGRPRRVFFGVESREDGGPCIIALREWLAVRPHTEATAVFVARDGMPLSTDQARRIYKALGESSGVPHCHPHRGRHTAASEFLAELPGAELHLRKRLGHVSAAVLEDYITISDDSARHVAESASLSQKWDL